MRAFVLFGFAVGLVACPPAGKKEAPPTVCTKVGQTCEFSPGKLGSCVHTDGCFDEGPKCFVCQSQH